MLVYGYTQRATPLKGVASRVSTWLGQTFGAGSFGSPFAWAGLGYMPELAANLAPGSLLRRSRPREEFGQLLVDFLALGDELLGAVDLLVDGHGSLHRRRFGAQIGFDEVALIVRKDAMPIEIFPLPYDLRVQNTSPPTGLRGLTIERNKVFALHRARRVLASKREVVPAAPVAPVVPGAEGVVYLRVALDRPLRSAAVDEHAATGVEVVDQSLVGLWSIVGDVVAGGQDAIADR